MVFRLGRDPVSFRTMKCVVLTIHHAFPNPSSTIASSLSVKLLAAPLNPHLSRRHHITPSPSLSGCMLLQQWIQNDHVINPFPCSPKCWLRGNHEGDDPNVS
ncbi:uncharacterized protein K444DRAFT_210532 [Hyaloscypha bicolor E]|uniref:Uncharacterized protein n=1 Tax=Hyaloscypha bicolor E TaxID=1095630 RepID=A0A2J6TPQ2_9HELO|nr:uncharacterized protein K444DRAFT_210532 [Hyaloscypha bicolor E]PMD64990.1 hypothetical protein K444DRAFT_210532 [Hyaloscypha bicolor E]